MDGVSNLTPVKYGGLVDKAMKLKMQAQMKRESEKHEKKEHKGKPPSKGIAKC